MFGADNSGVGLDTIARVIQVALTPVFLLSGIATLLNVFSTRLARVADRVETVRNALAQANAAQADALAVQLIHLRRRSVALDCAVVLGAVGGAATCGAVLALFVGALRDATIGWLLVSLFGMAVVCALGAIVAFTSEMLMAGFGIRLEVANSQRSVSEGETADAEPPDDADGEAAADTSAEAD